jgi:hypothetical protein
MALAKVKYKPGREGMGSIKVTTQPVRLDNPRQVHSNGPLPPHPNQNRK